MKKFLIVVFWGLFIYGIIIYSVGEYFMIFELVKFNFNLLVCGKLLRKIILFKFRLFLNGRNKSKNFILYFLYYVINKRIFCFI